LSFRILCIGDIPESVAPHLLGDVSITCAGGAFEALGLLRCEVFDTVLASVPVPGCSTPETLLDEIQRVSRSVRVILYDPSMDVERAMALARRGAFDIVDEERLNRVLASSIASAKANVPDEQSPREPWRDLLIGNSARMQTIAEMIRLIANRRCTVLITGETGTGKEMIARALHQAGNRSQYAMVSLNCSALPEALPTSVAIGSAAAMGRAHSVIGCWGVTRLSAKGANGSVPVVSTRPANSLS